MTGNPQHPAAQIDSAIAAAEQWRTRVDTYSMSTAPTSPVWASIDGTGTVTALQLRPGVRIPAAQLSMKISSALQQLVDTWRTDMDSILDEFTDKLKSIAPQREGGER
ncbi:hypothetical protein [Mycobacteroides chelonae]|uniref:hypothetical protein n=1 Tax=Mycobacteroides chelonae TaxID=1774 RepID=UPI000993FBEC|nr:hypothetical protein [Mycobacteroides chelonae]